MRVTEFIIEAAYDSMLDALVRKYPDYEKDIKWGKNLKKQDRVVWYLNVLKQYLPNPNDTVLGGEKDLGQFQEKLTHYLGQNIPKIDAVVFKNEIQAIDLFNQFAQIEQEHQSKQRKEVPPAIQKGDYKLIPFSNGSAWWYINRAYCSDEARSGGHCGNVVGKKKTDQRILSYRDANNHVIMTFILEPDGTLGEMKARFNQKPDPKYHPYIMQLLLNDMVKGITGKGYLPDMNFSIFDLDEKNLDIIDKNKPKLITDQLKITPIELLKAPKHIQQKYIQYVPDKIKPLLSNPSIETWERVMKYSPRYILYAPNEIPNYREKLYNFLRENPKDLLKARSEWRNDFELLSDLVSYNGNNIKYITPNTKNYDKLALKAVQQNGRSLNDVPEELRTPEICLAAVKQDGSELYAVPEELRTPEICLAAVKQDGYALKYVPEKLRTPEICLAAVKQDGYALKYVPEKLRTPKLCLAAVQQYGFALRHVPEKLRTPKLCLAAVQQDYRALQDVPEELLTPELYLAAVQQDYRALKDVPEEFRTPEICLAAIKQNPDALRYVPADLRPVIRDKLEQEKNTNEDLYRLKDLAGINK